MHSTARTNATYYYGPMSDQVPVTMSYYSIRSINRVFTFIFIKT